MVVLIVLGLFIVQIGSWSITGVSVPRWAWTGGAAQLRCTYSRQRGDPPLHSVKWYRDTREIFRFSPALGETRVFNNSWVSVVNSSCNTQCCEVTVSQVRGSAQYTCEVSSEGPRFAVHRAGAHMTQAVLPAYDPLITGLPTLVSAGEMARVNCSSDYSLPPATLHWFVDNEPIEDPLLSDDTHISAGDSEGLSASWRTLVVDPEEFATSRGYLSLRCRATVATQPPHERSMSVRLYVEPANHVSTYMFSKNHASSRSSRSVSVPACVKLVVCLMLIKITLITLSLKVFEMYEIIGLYSNFFEFVLNP